VGKAVQRQRNGTSRLSDKTRSGRPDTASDHNHQDRIEEVISGNRRKKKKSVSIGISKERVGHRIRVLGL